ncbi:hypothetical protein B6A14_03235 [Polynucleobacter hirudinilacicola]|uniref:Oligosaccharide repeat unit polymerase n=1 Tax=Polynucleobacter hirudinilacicola TaxID=1743166 RepID=A0A210RYY4_9BURK|nr:hypothetical protein [Polynucleobacter hirudinilacicola]OWF66225.1 hypothetical protein B6A14_03235 [Polynucleobacter hirudinilacicola]
MAVKKLAIYLPLLLVETYLIGTIIVFLFGPIKYYLESPFEFFCFIFFYHACSLFGYVMGVARTQCRVMQSGARFFYKPYYALLVVGLFAFLIGHKNFIGVESIIPYDLLDGIQGGLRSSSEQYVIRNESQALYGGDKGLNALYFLIAFSKIIIIPIVVFYWDKLTILARIVGVGLSILPVLSGISVGTNNPIFQFVIFYGVSLFLFFARNKILTGRCDFKSRSFFLFTVSSLFVFALFFFGNAMLGRGGDPSYLEKTSPLGHIKIDPSYIYSDEDSFASYLYVWLSNYLVQGYYGLSRAMEVDFTSTFGFGSSQFVARQVQWLFGIDVLNSTYQHKVNSFWDENAQWHSMYSHLANDFSFFGVGIVMFIIFYNFARVWLSFICLDSFYAKLLLPLFGLMFVFMPANNQVFGFLETFSAFWIVYICWLAKLPRSFTRHSK